MKKILLIGIILAILIVLFTVVTAGNGRGPSDGAGDCEPNEEPYGPNGSEKGPGPFDFSGDGIPQGYPWGDP